ncbi:hypothetical protein D3C81_1513430 [compost metagenome]
MMQPFITDFAELAEDLKVSAGFGQYAAGLKQQLIEVAVYFDAFGFQGAGDRGIPPGFMDAVFVVEVQCVDLQLPAQVEQYRWRLIPARGRADQQGNIQLTQFMAQLRQIAQPEIHFAGGVVMLQPLLGTQQIHRHTRSASGGGREGGVVMQAQVAAQPDQLHRLIHAVHLNQPTLNQYLMCRQGIFGQVQMSDIGKSC